MRIVVAGGSGVVGRYVVGEAERRGHETVVLARSTGVDLTDPSGLSERLEGADAVIDVSGTATQSRQQAEAFFGSVTGHLLAAEQQAGCGHHVALSIIGIDRVPTGYYRGKRLQEQRVSDGPVPWTVLRAAQFHEFAEQALRFAVIGPFSMVPAMLTQPVAAREVAAALVLYAEKGPSGRAPDLAGPEVHRLAHLARRVSRARGLGRRVVEVPTLDAAGRAMRKGALTAGTTGTRGEQTFDDWLEAGRN